MLQYRCLAEIDLILNVPRKKYFQLIIVTPEPTESSSESDDYDIYDADTEAPEEFGQEVSDFLSSSLETEEDSVRDHLGEGEIVDNETNKDLEKKNENTQKNFELQSNDEVAHYDSELEALPDEDEFHEGHDDDDDLFSSDHEDEEDKEEEEEKELDVEMKTNRPVIGNSTTSDTKRHPHDASLNLTAIADELVGNFNLTKSTETDESNKLSNKTDNEMSKQNASSYEDKAENLSITNDKGKNKTLEQKGDKPTDFRGIVQPNRADTIRFPPNAKQIEIKKPVFPTKIEKAIFPTLEHGKKIDRTGNLKPDGKHRLIDNMNNDYIDYLNAARSYIQALDWRGGKIENSHPQEWQHFRDEFFGVMGKPVEAPITPEEDSWHSLNRDHDSLNSVEQVKVI